MSEPAPKTPLPGAAEDPDDRSESLSRSVSHEVPPPGDESVEQAQALQKAIESGDSSVVPQLISRLKRSDDKLMIRLLIRVISTLAAREHLRKLSKLYRHRDTHVRLWTLAAIARLEDHEYFPLIVHGLFYDKSKRVRSASRRTLRKLTPDQLERLVASMEINSAAWMQEAAAHARRELAPDRPIPVPKRAYSSSQELVIQRLKGADLGPRDPAYDAGPAEAEAGGEDEIVVSSLGIKPPRPADPREKALGIAEAIAQQGKDAADRTFSRRDCPACGERIMVEALLCRYCNTVFEPAELEKVMELAQVRVVPLAVRSPSHRGSALILDACLAGLLLPVGGLGAAYFLLRDSLGDGASLGKRVYGLRVVDAESGEKCGRMQSAMRQVTMLVPLAPVVELVKLSADGQRFGDRFANTRVIFGEDPPATAILASAAMFMFSVGALIIVLLLRVSAGGAAAGFR